MWGGVVCPISVLKTEKVIPAGHQFTIIGVLNMPKWGGSVKGHNQ